MLPFNLSSNSTWKTVKSLERTVTDGCPPVSQPVAVSRTSDGGRGGRSCHIYNERERERNVSHIKTCETTQVTNVVTLIAGTGGLPTFFFF